MERVFLICGALFGFLAVALGAFGTHGLKGRLEPKQLEIFEVAVRYQMYHALALLGVAWASSRWPGRLTAWAGRLMVGGIVVFSGSLYLLCLTATPAWGAVTPLGGLALMGGWLCLAWSAMRSGKRE